MKVHLTLNIPGASAGFGLHVPISLLYLGAQLTADGHTVEVSDRRTFPSEQAYLNAIKDSRCDLLGMCLFADTYTYTYQLLNRIRRVLPRVPVVLGGPEASANREQVFEIFARADYLLAGEAEYTLSALATHLEHGDGEAVRTVPGLSFREDGVSCHNPVPPPVRDVDSIPFPRRDLIDPANWQKFYFRLGFARPTDVMLTSRGCPFSCRFCYRLAPRYRARSPENVLEEIGEIHARGTRGINIVDDNFTVNKRRCAAIIEGILEKGWRFNIRCRGRVNSVDPEMLRLMKRAGFSSITFGIESGSQKVLDAMNKKTTVEQNRRAIRMVKEAGMDCFADLFVGFPGETPETIKETTDFLLETKPTGINLSHLYPLHSTEVYEEAKREQTLVGDWGVLEDYPWVRLPWLNDIDELRRKRYSLGRTFWRNPAVMARALKSTAFHVSLRDYWTVWKGMRTGNL